MCYQIAELYSACRCLYYQHPVDRCAVFGRAGHSIQKRSILVGHSCTEHAKEPWFSQDYRGLQPGHSDADCHDEKAKPTRWCVLADPQERNPLVALLGSVVLKPFDLESWVVYLYSSEPPSENLVGSPGHLTSLLTAPDTFLPSLYCTSSLLSLSSDPTYDPRLPGLGPGGSAATKSSFVPTPRPASLFSAPNGSSTDMSDRESWPDDDTVDSSDQASTTQSESSDTLEDEHYFNDIREYTINAVLSRFHAYHRGSQASQDSNQPVGNEPSSAGRGNSSNRSTRKRSRSTDNYAESSPSNVVQDCKKQRPAPEHNLLFACTFFKKDTLRHRACEKAGQKRIRDVKQHLRRKHFDPFYCSRCWTVFDSEQQRDEHTRVQLCELQPDEVREQLSLTQVMALNKKVNHKLTPTVQWFSVWDICFPDQPRPASPYIDPELSEQLSSFHVYYTEHGPDIIYNALSESNMLNCQLPNEERDLAAFRQSVLRGALDRIYELWVDTRRPSHARIASSNPSSVSGSDSRPAEFNEVLSAVNSISGEPSISDFDGGISVEELSPSQEAQSQFQLDDIQVGVGSLFDFPVDPFCLNDEQFDFGSLAGDYGNGFDISQNGHG